MKALQGRALIYDLGAKLGATELAEALTKNLYATVEKPAPAILNAMSEYVISCNQSLASQKMNDFMNGQIVFPNLPQAEGDRHVEISQVA